MRCSSWVFPSQIQRRFVRRRLCFDQTGIRNLKNRENFFITNSNYQICSRFPFNKIKVVEFGIHVAQKRATENIGDRVRVKHLKILKENGKM